MFIKHKITITIDGKKIKLSRILNAHKSGVIGTCDDNRCRVVMLFPDTTATGRHMLCKQYLGRYATPERASEVVDEIFQAIEEGQRTFVMPEA